MSHNGKNIAFVIIATATLLIGFSAKPTNAVQIQVSQTAPPLTAESTAMIHTSNKFDLTKRNREVECLARNMYFEARGEPTAGQLAVGQVTINRTKDDNYPHTICAVVSQPSQFSWKWDGKSDVIAQPKVYSNIKTLAEILYDDYYLSRKFPDIVDGATYFHTATVHPNWNGVQLVARIGNHNFYKKKVKPTRTRKV